MRWKWLVVLSIVGVVILVFNIVNLLNQDFDLNREDTHQTTIHVWTTTPRLSNILQQYETESDVQIDLKQFQDIETLLEELELSQAIDAIPDVIEVDSRSGLESVMDTHPPIPLKHLSGDMPGLFHTSIVDHYQKEEELLAYPLGIELPVMFANQSLLDQHMNMNLFPFQSDAQINHFKDIQERYNSNHRNEKFWFYHFDEHIDRYWGSYQLTSSSGSFEDMWQTLTQDYKLMPTLDHHMALTRFSNMEVGVLMSSSTNLQTLQQSIGNDFEFTISPFRKETKDSILILGHGLVVLEDKPVIKDLFTFLSGEEVQKDLLGKAGWLPAQTRLLEDTRFIRSLPMSKYLINLIEARDGFVGVDRTADHTDIQFILDKAYEIEVE